MLADIADAAQRVVDDTVENIHPMIHDLASLGVDLPVLGLFIFRDRIELDYRMGRKWTPAKVTGLFEFLLDCNRIASTATQ